MGNYPRVKDVLIVYNTSGIEGVSKYLHDDSLTIDPSTWIGKIKRLIKEKKIYSVEAEIASMLFTFKLTEKDERERTRYDEFSDHEFEDGGDVTE